MEKPAGTGELPPVLEEFAAEYPQVWEAYNRLGEATASAGPLDEKTQRLLKLAIAIGSQRQGAVNSHTRRALRAGCTPEEFIHVGILAISTIGWPGAFAATGPVGGKDARSAHRSRLQGPAAFVQLLVVEGHAHGVLPVGLARASENERPHARRITNEGGTAGPSSVPPAPRRTAWAGELPRDRHPDAAADAHAHARPGAQRPDSGGNGHRRRHGNVVAR